MIAQSKRTLQSEHKAESLPVGVGMFFQELLEYLQGQRWEYDRATAALPPQKRIPVPLVREQSHVGFLLSEHHLALRMKFNVATGYVQSKEFPPLG